MIACETPCRYPECTYPPCVAARNKEFFTALNHTTDDPNTFRVCHDPNCAYGPCVRAKGEARKEEVWSRNWRAKVSALEASLQESREKRDRLNDECNKLDRENRDLKKCNKASIDRNDFLFGQLSESKTVCDNLKADFNIMQASLSHYKERCKQYESAHDNFRAINNELSKTLASLANENQRLAAEYAQTHLRNAEVIRELDNWKSTAERNNRNENWLRGLLEEIGNLFGAASKRDNTGQITPDIFVSKLPDLVREVMITHKADPRVKELEAQLEKEKRARGIAYRDNERLLNRLDQVKNAASGGYEKKS